MGSLFGYYGQKVKKTIDFIESLDIKPLHTIKAQKFFLALGGIPETCIVNKDKDSGWAVLGLGIILNNNRSKIMNKEDWQYIMKSNINEEINREVNGHYIIAKWQKNNINFISDPLGIRNLYYYNKNNEKVFSTRLDWITKFRKSCQIDFETFGSSWLSYNNLSYKPIVEDIESIGPGGKISIIDEKFNAEREEWLPSFKNYDFTELKKRLEAILHPHYFKDRILTFGLSGGFDSRILLSILFPSQQKIRRIPVDTFTIGEKGEPDVEIAKRITKDLQIPHIQLKEQTKYDITYLSDLKAYISQTNLVEPASTYQKLRHFSSEYFKNKIFIDGAFGGIGRRDQHKRLIKFGYKGLKKGNVELIYKHIKFSRGDIFLDEYMEKMKKGTFEQIEELLKNLPSVNDIGCETFVDLFTIKTRPPNYSGLEQTRLDSYLVSYIPFLQKDVLDPIFSLDLCWKENGRYFRKIIKELRPELSYYPIVKENTSLPFFIPTLTALQYVKIKNKLFPGYNKDLRIAFYKNIKEDIFQILNSNDFKNFSPYNHKEIKKKVQDFYSGSTNNINELDWWYTFEIWRKELGIE